MQQAAKSTITLGLLTVLLVLVGLWGWNAATDPLPGKSDPPKCVPTSVAAGDKVFPQQVTVSVYNASDTNGLAGRTMDVFDEAGFNQGDTANAPRNAQVTTSAIWTSTPENPDVLLVASRLGQSVDVVRRDGLGVGVTVIVGDEFEDLVRGKKSMVAEDDADICSPPVN